MVCAVQAYYSLCFADHRLKHGWMHFTVTCGCFMLLILVQSFVILKCPGILFTLWAQGQPCNEEKDARGEDKRCRKVKPWPIMQHFLLGIGTVLSWAMVHACQHCGVSNLKEFLTFSFFSCGHHRVQESSIWSAATWSFYLFWPLRSRSWFWLSSVLIYLDKLWWCSPSFPWWPEILAGQSNCCLVDFDQLDCFQT